MEKDYGNVISKLRKQHKLTQQELGKRLNVSYQAVSKWENNQSQPDLQTLELLVEVFGISLNQFFEMANQKNVESVEPVVSQNIQTQSKLSTANGKFKKFMATPWFVVSILSVIVLVFGLIAIFVPARYSKEQIYAKASDKIVSVNINGSNYTGFFIDSYGTAVFAYYQPLYINKATVSFNGSEKRYNITKILGCKDFFVVAQVDIKNSPCIKTSYKYNPKIEEKVYVMDIYNRTKLRIQECLVGQVNYSNGVNEFDLAGGSTFAVVLNARAQVVALTNTNAGGLTHAISISAINDIKRDNPRDLQVDIENSLNQYLIKYDANGGEGTMEDQICDVEGYYNLRLNKFIKTGYKFVCWKYLDKSYTDTQYVSQLAQAGETTTLYAQWEPIQYQIEFICEGQESYTQTLTYGQQEQLLENRFVLEHAHFDHWSCSNGCNYSDMQYVSNLTTIENDTFIMTLVAREYVYKINYYESCNGLALSSTYTYTYNYSEVYSVKSAEYHVGYVFRYWIDSNGNKYNNDESKGYNTTFSKLGNTDNERITFTGVYDEVAYNVYIKNSVTEELYFFGRKSYYEKFYLPECPFEPEYGYELVKYETRKKGYRKNQNGQYVETISSTYYDIGRKCEKMSTIDNDDVIFWTVFDTIKYEINYYYEVNSTLFQQYRQVCEYGQENEIKSCRLLLTDELIGDYWVDEDNNKYRNISDGNIDDKYITTLNKTYAGEKEILNLYLVLKDKSYEITFINSLTNETIELGEKSYKEFNILPDCPFEIQIGYEFDCYKIYAKNSSNSSYIQNSVYYPGQDISNLMLSYHLDYLYITVIFKQI